MDPMQWVEGQRDVILQTYDDLHQLAEPSWKEEKTSRYLQERLRAAGFQIQTFQNHYGFTAELQGLSADTIALRADMDALLQEVDGKTIANHACGHDAHSTMVLMAALALAEQKIKFKHHVRFIFQPAEETANGALQMMEDGALDRVKFLGGIHLRPSFEVPFGKAAPVILHGSSATLKGTIKGESAHAARPEEGINPIETAALLIQAMMQIRLRDVGKYSIKMTELHSGVASNAIPETARFTFDLRAETNEGMEWLIQKAFHTIRKIALLTETEIEAAIDDEYSPAAIKHRRAVQLAEKAITAIVGSENLEPYCASPGAEDFHFYTLKNRALAATMIGLGCDLTPGLHHPKMRFNKEALIYGTKILIQLILNADEEEWNGP